MVRISDARALFDDCTTATTGQIKKTFGYDLHHAWLPESTQIRVPYNKRSTH
jgi:hypothetical protein